MHEAFHVLGGGAVGSENLNYASVALIGTFLISNVMWVVMATHRSRRVSSGGGVPLGCRARTHARTRARAHARAHTHTHTHTHHPRFFVPKYGAYKWFRGPARTVDVEDSVIDINDASGAGAKVVD